MSYVRSTPEDSLVRQVFVEQWPRLQRELREANEGRGPPKFITKAVNAFLDCGFLSKGFCRLYCKSCKSDQLVAFSSKSRGICSSCDGRRMTELAAHLCDSVIGEVPVRQFVVTTTYI
ncbi:MAG: transposase zinc-binding domain-containing protein [Deltaproteobacteria bacterium]|nr:transposase zinc-binding domain-containing protein [Deltaproteobacteria bacterium]